MPILGRGRTVMHMASIPANITAMTRPECTERSSWDTVDEDRVRMGVTKGYTSNEEAE